MSLREVRFYIDAFPEGGIRDDSEIDILILLEALTAMDQNYLRRHPETPLLYDLYRQGRIEYKLPTQMEQGGVNAETFRTVPRIIENGGGDCDNIACWRAAEYRIRGIAARPYITNRKNPQTGGTIYHVIVKMPDGSSEDPCLLIGMAPERADEIANEQAKLQERVVEAAQGLLAERNDPTLVGENRSRSKRQLLDVMGWLLRSR